MDIEFRLNYLAYQSDQRRLTVNSGCRRDDWKVRGFPLLFWIGLDKRMFDQRPRDVNKGKNVRLRGADERISTLSYGDQGSWPPCRSRKRLYLTRHASLSKFLSLYIIWANINPYKKKLK
jgi:hypothetical protein